MKNLTLIILMGFSTLSFCQEKGFYYPHKDSLKNESVRVQKAEANIKKAYEAYNNGDLKKTRYYLAQSEGQRHVNASFYYLLGQWCYDKKKFSSARRLWMRGYKRKGCWECKELYHKMREDTNRGGRGLVIGIWIGMGGIAVTFIFLSNKDSK